MRGTPDGAALGEAGTHAKRAAPVTFAQVDKGIVYACAGCPDQPLLLRDLVQYCLCVRGMPRGFRAFELLRLALPMRVGCPAIRYRIANGQNVSPMRAWDALQVGERVSGIGYVARVCAGCPRPEPIV